MSDPAQSVGAPTRRVRNSQRRAWALLSACLHDADSRGWLAVQVGIGVLVVSSIGVWFGELRWESDAAMVTWLEAVDSAILWILVVELGLRIATFQPLEVRFFAAGPLRRLKLEVMGRLRFMLRPLNLADLLAVLAVVPALRGLRGLRVLRLLRGARVFRYANPFSGIARAFVDNRLPFAFAIAFFLGAVLLSGTIFYMVEHRANAQVSSLGDGYWWSIVTISTVGFGDIAPVTTVGRVVAAGLMVVGIFNIALFAGIVGHTMLSVVLTVRQEQFRMAGYVDHLVVCGYDPAARHLLDDITAEVGKQFEGAMVVFGGNERPTDLGADFAWVAGDPTKESELDKARLDHAAVAIIVGSRTSTPQVADAVTILTAFTIRRRLRVARLEAPRARPLYLIAEILDSENVEHARAAGCDEVIETNRLGFALLAHATAMHGTAAMLAEVASRGSQSLYVGVDEHAVEGAVRTFAEVASALRQRHGLLLVGLRDASSREHVINPPPDHPVAANALLLYFAADACLSRDP